MATPDQTQSSLYKGLAQRNPTASVVDIYLESLAPSSRRNLRHALATVAQAFAGKAVDPGHFNWGEMTTTQLLGTRERLRSKYKPATLNKMFSAVRGVIRTAVQISQASPEALRQIEAIPWLPVGRLPESKPVTAAQVRRLFSTCANDPTPKGARDAALLAIFLSSGLRRAEAASLVVEDYDPSTGRLTIRASLPERRRAVGLDPNARRTVEDWLAVRGSAAGPLIVGVNKSGRIGSRALTAQAIYDIIRRRASEARLPYITSRLLRRSYVLGLIASGLSLDEVQERVGHASWVTTASYAQLAKEQKKRGYRPLSLPNVRSINDKGDAS